MQASLFLLILHNCPTNPPNRQQILQYPRAAKWNRQHDSAGSDLCRFGFMFYGINTQYIQAGQQEDGNPCRYC